MLVLDMPISSSKRKLFYVSVYYENAWLVRKVEAALKRVFRKPSEGGMTYSSYQRGPDKYQRLVVKFAVYAFDVKDREVLRRLKTTLKQLQNAHPEELKISF